MLGLRGRPSGSANVTARPARWALAVALTLTASTGAIMPHAAAGEAADAARKWGLIGTWAADCSVPPDKTTPQIIYAIGSGDRVMLRRDYGWRKDEMEIGTVEIAGDGSLHMRTVFPELKQIRDSAIAMAPDGSIRALSNRTQKAA